MPLSPHRGLDSASLDLGGLMVTPVLAGRFALDGGAMYGVIPRPLWSKVTPPDDRHRIPMVCNCLLVDTEEGDRCLIDTGLGQRFESRARDIFSVDAEPSLTSSLASVGVDPEHITHVLFTHLHFDHCAGALIREGTTTRALFPQARHLVQSVEIDEAMAGHSIMRASYVADDIDLLRRCTDFDGLSGDSQILPRIHTWVTGGHTRGHQAILLRGRDRTLAFPGDLIPTRHHLKPYWIMAYDMHPHDTLRRKADFIDRALAEDWIIGWDHDPEGPFSQLRREGDLVTAVDPSAIAGGTASRAS
ncbi:MAG: MBL fold metallo-hydrolase [Gemmatimonadetes bacterium]|nr:MBL fold metallo-hydrolase [Gemmatimonadota bacterium]